MHHTAFEDLQQVQHRENNGERISQATLQQLKHELQTVIACLTCLVPASDTITVTKHAFPNSKSIVKHMSATHTSEDSPLGQTPTKMSTGV